MPTPLPSLAGSIVLKAVADLPARLFGGNAQQVQVTGLDYTLHLDIQKLPESENLTSDDQWAPVWDETTDTYKRVNLGKMPAEVSVEQIDDRVAALLQAGDNITLNYNDAGGSLTITASSAAGGGMFDTRAEAEAANLDPGTKTFLVAGYSAPGDCPPMTFKRVNAQPAHKGRLRTADRYLATGVEDAVNGGWAELVPIGTDLFIEWFGGKNDSDVSGTAATDNLGPLFDAIAFVVWQVNPQYQFSHRIRFKEGNYYFSDTIELHNIVHLRGVEGGTKNAGTFFQFPANKSYLIFGHNSSSGLRGTGVVNAGESVGSSIDGITLSGKSGFATTARDLAGVCCRACVAVRNVTVYYVGGNGFEIIGGSVGGGVVDHGLLENCQVHSASGNGLYVNGNDAQLWTITNFDAHGPSWQEGNPLNGGIGGCGIIEYSSFGNTYITPHIAGFGNLGVHRAGVQYRLISVTPGIGSSTTPGTNDLVWYAWGPGGVTAQFPEWSAINTYLPQIPVLTNGSSSVFISLYIETGVPAHMPGGTISVGGAAAWTKYSAQFYALASGALVSPNGVGGRYQLNSGQEGYGAMGADGYTIVGRRYDDNKGQGLLNHRREKDPVADYDWRYLDEDIVYTAPGENDGYPTWKQTTKTSTVNFGRPANHAGKIVFFDPMLHDTSKQVFSVTDKHLARAIGIRDGAAPTNSQHGVGDFYFNYAAGGPMGWRCTVAGAPGTFRAVYAEGIETTASYDPPSIAANAVATIQTMTINGAALSDAVDATFSLDLQGVRINAWVSAANTVSYQFANPTAAPIDLGSGTVKCRVRK